jgi:hypothetical protein
MDENWTIGVNGDKYLRSSSDNSLVGDFKIVPGDTIIYHVQTGMDLSDKGKKRVIGRFILIKKTEI